MDFERDLEEFAENDLRELLDSDYYVEALRAAGEFDLSTIIDGTCSFGGNSGVVLNDRLITEASMGLISHLGSLTPLTNFLPNGKPPNSFPIKSEHSYSMSEEGTDGALLRNIDEDLSDLENECYPAVSITEAEGSRAPNKNPLFASMNPSRSEIRNENELSTFPETTTLQRHLSTETLSCCGDCGDCDPDEEILNSSLPSSPFPLIRFHDDDEDEIIVLPEESDLQSQQLLQHLPQMEQQLLQPQQQQYQQQQQQQNHSQPIHPQFLPQHQQQHQQEDQSYHSQQPISSRATSTDHCQNLSSPSGQQVALITVSSACTKTTNSTENKINRSPKISKPIVITHNKPQRTNNVHNVHGCVHEITSMKKQTHVEEKKSIVVMRQDSNTSNKETGFLYPPTPPSCSGSDSESGGFSPTRSNPLYEMVPPPLINMKKIGPVRTTSRNPIHTHLISSQPKGATGTLYLTDEEKRTLLSEGYAIPSKLPLTKAEEKSLKKIRRKIKNKISAQESRRKKKEYMDTLEHKVDLLTQENNAFRRKYESLQHKNSQLLQELERLQSLVNREEKCTKRLTQKATIIS